MSTADRTEVSTAERQRDRGRSRVEVAPTGLLTTRGAAAALGITRAQVRQWVMQGRLQPEPERGPNNRRYYTGAEVERARRSRPEPVAEHIRPEPPLRAMAAAALLGISAAQLRQLVARGVAQPMDPPRRPKELAFSRAEVERLEQQLAWLAAVGGAVGGLERRPTASRALPNRHP